MVVVPSGYEVGELAKKYFFASLCARPNLARREIERGATPLTDRVKNLRTMYHPVFFILSEEPKSFGFG